ncbi:IclR family transcriptional regulator [Jatrophihabitans endophyticus]|uniref:IclR family transcriptional regulator n=1 Tax=Jatrophihabitans endophyticus TaxID=1206085 RepID=UPI000932AEA0|nr:IclR family transcriptional regulator [Jatrophihabitans endophyticus]
MSEGVKGVGGTAAGSTPKALALLDALAASASPVQLAALAATCGLSKPSTHRVLSTLRDAGWVRAHEGGLYSLGSDAFAFAARAGQASSVTAVLTRLRDEVGHTVHAGLVAEDVVVYTHKVDGHDQFAMRSRVGGTMPLHSTGIGKALLAFGPSERVDAVVARGLARRTPNTITAAARLRRELAAVREQGYAVDDEENEQNIRCVACPVPSPDGRPVTAVSISTVTFLTPREELLGYVPAARAAAAALAGG